MRGPGAPAGVALATVGPGARPHRPTVGSMPVPSRRPRADTHRFASRRAGRRARAARARALRIALVLAAAMVLAACASAPVPQPPDSVGTPLDQPIPASVAALPLLDSTGRRTDLAAFRGKVLVISDMMTLCQETCPLDTANIVATARRVEKAGLGSKVEFLSITIDPQRDTTARLAAYRKLFAPAPSDWAVVGGPASSLTALWHYLGLYYEKAPEESPPGRDWLTGKPLTYDISHADLVYFVAPDGHQRYTVDGTAHVASEGLIPGALRRFLSDQGTKNLEHPGFGAWTVGQALQVLSWLTDTRIPGADTTTGNSSPVVVVGG